MKRLIFADVHANFAALEAVFEHERAWDELIFLGDAVIGGPQPEACVSLLREMSAAMSGGSIALQGNHDLQAVEARIEPNHPNLNRQWARWTQQHLSDDSRAYLAAMQPSCAIERDGWHLRLHHGNFPNGLGRFWPDADDTYFTQLAELHAEPAIIAAHSHVQFQVEREGRTFINPGSVGQPRLGQPLACYMVLQDGAMQMRAVPYDIERTCRAMDDVPLPAEFVEMWKGIYRNGMLSSRYPIRDWQPLIDAGYR